MAPVMNNKAEKDYRKDKKKGMNARPWNQDTDSKSTQQR